MSNKITVTFASTYNNANEALDVAAPYLESSTGTFLRQIHFWTVLALVTIGILASTDFVLGFEKRVEIFYGLFAAALLAFLVLNFPNRLDRNVYKRFEQTEEGARSTADIDETGFTLRTSHSNWFIGWSGISAVFETQNTVGIVHATGPTYIPKSAFDDPSAIVSQMRKWHQAGHSA